MDTGSYSYQDGGLLNPLKLAFQSKIGTMNTGWDFWEATFRDNREMTSAISARAGRENLGQPPTTDEVTEQRSAVDLRRHAEKSGPAV